MGLATAIRLRLFGTVLTNCLRSTLRMGRMAIAGGNPIRFVDLDGECPAFIFPLEEFATDAIIAT